MKSQMTSFDIAAAVGELQHCVGLRAEKFFLLGHRDMFFRMSGDGTKRSVSVHLNHGIWMEDGYRTTADSEPPTFAMLLRKHLSGAVLNRVSQHGFDRIVVFGFGQDDSVHLVAELFGSGNIVLVKDGTIIQPLTSKSWRARDIKAGSPYMFPPESVDPFRLDRDALSSIIRNSVKDLVRCLATEVNLGGIYAEDACLQLGAAKSSKAAGLPESEIAKLAEIIMGYSSKLKSPEPCIVEDGQGLPADLVPFPLSLYAGMETRRFGSFGAAAKEFFSNLPKAGEISGKSPRQKQLERQLEAQKEAKKSLDAEAEECQRLGDAVYANYSALDTLLSRLSSVLSSGNWQAVSREVLSMSGVSGFDPAEGKVSVLLADGSEAKLDVRLDINGNASALYDRAKKARQKADGAEAAMRETAKLLTDVERVPPVSSETFRKPTKQFWFDRYRWFLSSEGFLVVGGRDTRSNDQLVKKHLQDGDLYVHSDANGAPSVVIKDGRKAGEPTLEEACIFAVSFSRAWKSRLASGSAYWVMPDQVSKTPEPGEYVPKGAFIIRGKRNYSKKVEIKLAIGMVKVDGHEKVMCGPVNAVRALAGEYRILEPGGEKRSDFTKMLSDLYRVPIEEIDRALPPGDLAVTELTRR